MGHYFDQDPQIFLFFFVALGVVVAEFESFVFSWSRAKLDTSLLQLLLRLQKMSKQNHDILAEFVAYRFHG